MTLGVRESPGKSIGDPKTITISTSRPSTASSAAGAGGDPRPGSSDEELLGCSEEEGPSEEPGAGSSEESGAESPDEVGSSEEPGVASLDEVEYSDEP